MPNFNGTGPNGRGSMTGRGQGPCGNGLFRRRMFSGPGRGFGFRRRLSKDEELGSLKEYKNELLKEIEEIEKVEKELNE